MNTPTELPPVKTQEEKLPVLIILRFKSVPENLEIATYF